MTEDLQTGDPVDEIQVAWARERPDLPVGSIAVITRIHRLSRELGRRRAALLRRHGTDASTLDLLGVLRRSGPPYELTAGEIARRTRITTGGVSQRLARAERAGLVERRRAEGDSRSVTVRMTAAGMRLLDATVAELFAEEEATLDALSEVERRQLADLLRRYLNSLA
jgi:DNA-binding MarR family transcriptional regulator